MNVSKVDNQPSSLKAILPHTSLLFQEKQDRPGIAFSIARSDYLIATAKMITLQIELNQKNRRFYVLVIPHRAILNLETLKKRFPYAYNIAVEPEDLRTNDFDSRIKTTEWKTQFDRLYMENYLLKYERISLPNCTDLLTRTECVRLLSPDAIFNFSVLAS